MTDKETPGAPTEDEWTAKRAGIVWADREKDLLREIDDKISGNVRTSMNNRELQQAILDTHAMLLKTGAMHHFQSILEKHYVQLLAVQRHRAGLTDTEQNG